MLVSWREVEAYLAAEYGLSLREVRQLPWRRFLVLVGRGFSIEAKGAKVAEADDGHVDFDWSIMDRAIGRETPTNVIRMTLDEYMAKVGT